MSDLQRLRDRVEELESAMGIDDASVARVRKVFKVTRVQACILNLLLRREVCSRPSLMVAIYGARPEKDQPEIGILAVEVSRLRKVIAPIEIVTHYGEGWSLWPADKDRIRAELAGEPAEEIPAFLPQRCGEG